MNTLDIIILLAVIVPGLWVGIKSGFLDQVVSLVAVLLGIWLSSIFAEPVGNMLGGFIKAAPVVIKIISFLLIFVAIYLILKAISKLILKFVDKVFGRGIDKLLGICLGILKYAILVGLLIMLFNYINGQFTIVSRETLEQSKVFVWMENFSSTIFPFLKSLICQKSC